MKKSLKLIAVLALFTQLISCNEKGYTISGTIDNKDIKNVYLQLSKDGKRPTNIDTAKVVDGKFTFTGTKTEPEIAYIAIDNNPQKARFFLENAGLKIVLYNDSIAKSKVTGGKINPSFNIFIAKTTALNDPLKKLGDEYQTALKNKDSIRLAQIKQEYAPLQKDIQNKQLAYYQEFITDNPKSYFSLILLRDLSKGNVLKKDVAQGLFNKLDNPLKKTPEGIKLQEKFNKKEAKPVAKQSMTIGTVVNDFSAPNPKGKKVSLNESKGKYTLVDFWASWCGPCRRENPNVLAAYKQYHDKGFNVIGVALDKDKAKWIAAIEKDGLPWNQISNLKFWNEPIAKSFGIRSIPQNFLIDENNKIVAVNLRGPALGQKLAELLK